MKERPILFSTPMVQAILDGRKTQTRRAMKPQPESVDHLNHKIIAYNGSPNLILKNLKCPYGNIDDVLWVRETWRPTIYSMPTGWPYDYRATAKEDGCPEEGPWKSSIFMPKEACRINLKITDIRVERLNDISENDCIAEGIESWFSYLFQETRYKDYECEISDWRNPDSSYRSLWEKINGKGSWQKNPWVWVIEFRRM